MQANEAERMNIYLPQKLKEWLEKQADYDHRSLNNYVVMVLTKHMEANKCILAR